MACKGCQKNRAKSGRVYVTCSVCGTDLHAVDKDIPKINGHKVCGLCFKKYKKIKELEKKVRE